MANNPPFTEFLVDDSNINGEAGVYTICTVENGADGVSFNISKPGIDSKMKTKAPVEEDEDLKLKPPMEEDEDVKLKKPIEPDEDDSPKQDEEYSNDQSAITDEENNPPLAAVAEAEEEDEEYLQMNINGDPDYALKPNQEEKQENMYSSSSLLKLVQSFNFNKLQYNIPPLVVIIAYKCDPNLTSVDLDTLAKATRSEYLSDGDYTIMVSDVTVGRAPISPPLNLANMDVFERALNPPEINVYAANHPYVIIDPKRRHLYDWLYVKHAHTFYQPFHFNHLNAQAQRNQLIELPHKNILGLVRPPFTYNSFYSVVLPNMDGLSLRYILRTRHTHGLPQDLILVALRETLNGLLVIHQAGELHKEINAGHIYFNSKPSPGQIKLGFAASVFDCLHDAEKPSYSSLTTICTWASAPEVHTSNGMVYTDKSDVWLIGILALELSYGRITVQSREEFDSIVAWIIREKGLPKKRDNEYLQVQPETVKTTKVEAVVDIEKKVLSKEETVKEYAKEVLGKDMFPKKLNKLVVKCLASNPEERPTVDQLLKKLNKGNMSFSLNEELLKFHNAAKPITNDQAT